VITNPSQACSRHRNGFFHIAGQAGRPDAKKVVKLINEDICSKHGPVLALLWKVEKNRGL
jgi:hypothetical protein